MRVMLLGCGSGPGPGPDSGDEPPDAALAALAQGTVLLDNASDWMATGNPDDNASPYHVGFADVLSVTVGIDADCLYAQVVVAAAFPADLAGVPCFGGDSVVGGGYNLSLDLDNNQASGCLSDGGAEVLIGFGSHAEGTLQDYCQYFTQPTGIEEPEEDRYSDEHFDGSGWHGLGHTDHYVAVPLSDRGVVSGQTITIAFWIEASSQSYHHASLDILDSAQERNRVTVVLGQNVTIPVGAP